jgi:hypothetical protein
VFPCKGRGKTPLTANGFKAATTDEGTIRAWWVRWPGANIGMPTGAASGIFVVDIDPRHGGLDAFSGLEEFHGEAPRTPRVSTQSGGIHIYLRHRGGCRNSAGTLATGVDTRGEGGYVILPPSVGESGSYEWEDGSGLDELDPADAPDWLIPGALPTPKLVTGNLGFVVGAATLVDAKAEVKEGGRNMTAASLAGKWVQAGHTLHEVRRLLDGWNKEQCKPPLRAEELDTVTASVARTHAKNNPAFPVPVASEPEPESGGAAVAELPEARPLAVRSPGLRPFPRHLLTPPGLVGDIANWINATAIKPQPVLALGTALAFVGAIVGRKVSTPTGLRSNLYVLGIGESGCGKDHSRKCVKRICDAAGLSEKILGGEEVSSDSAVMAAVAKNPSILFLWDEIGHLFSSVTSKYAASHVRAIAPTLTKLFSSADTRMLGKQFAHAERVDIDQPNACLYGTTVPDRLYSGLTPDEIRDGFLGRLLVFVSDDADPDERMIEREPVPEPITTMVQAWWNRTDLPRPPGNLAAVLTHSPIIVRCEPEAASILDAFRLRCRGHKAAARDGSGVDALWARALEHASKVALTVACGDGFATPVVSPTVANWAVEVVEHLTLTLAEAVRDSVSSTDYGREALKVYRTILRCGEKGATPTDVSRATQGLHPKLRETILNDLVSQGRIGLRDRKIAKGGRKTVVYYAVAV